MGCCTSSDAALSKEEIAATEELCNVEPFNATVAITSSKPKPIPGRRNAYRNEDDADEIAMVDIDNDSDTTTTNTTNSNTINTNQTTNAILAVTNEAKQLQNCNAAIVSNPKQTIKSINKTSKLAPSLAAKSKPKEKCNIPIESIKSLFAKHSIWTGKISIDYSSKNSSKEELPLEIMFIDDWESEALSNNTKIMYFIQGKRTKSILKVKKHFICFLRNFRFYFFFSCVFVHVSVCYLFWQKSLLTCYIFCYKFFFLGGFGFLMSLNLE